MSAAQNRFKQANAPLGLRPAAPSLPVQAWTGRRGIASGDDPYSVVPASSVVTDARAVTSEGVQ